jgi:hypothetical protein
MNPAISQSLLLAKHLRNRSPRDAAWVQALDKLFVSAAYELPTEDPIFSGPDNLAYCGFNVARSNDVELVDIKETMNHALHWAAGGVVYPGGGIEQWIYSAGDLVSIATVGTSAFQWQGDWGTSPIVADYGQGQGISVGRPNPEFLAPLAARSLEKVLRRIYAAEPRFGDRAPSILVARPESRTRPEQASELMINAFKEDFESPEAWDSFHVLVGRFLPAHLSRRLISFESQFLPKEKFTPLADLIS